MAFSFGFSGDDIEEDPADEVTAQTEQPGAPGSDVPPPIAARVHDLDELVSDASVIFMHVLIERVFLHSRVFTNRGIFYLIDFRYYRQNNSCVHGI